MDAKLRYCGDSIWIKDFYHNHNEEKAGNPYNCSFQIVVESGQFRGCADRCEYNYKEWPRFIKRLKQLMLNEIQHIVFQEIGEGNTIEFKGDGHGHIEVSGKIFDSAMTHTLDFSFMTDQTVYPQFIRELESFC